MLLTEPDKDRHTAIQRMDRVILFPGDLQNRPVLVLFQVISSVLGGQMPEAGYL